MTDNDNETEHPDDLVTKLLAPDYWISGSQDGHEGDNMAPVMAAHEIRRLRNELIMTKASSEGVGSVLLDVQRDCIRLRLALRAIGEIARITADPENVE